MRVHGVAQTRGQGTGVSGQMNARVITSRPLSFSVCPRFIVFILIPFFPLFSYCSLVVSVCIFSQCLYGPRSKMSTLQLFGQTEMLGGVSLGMEKIPDHVEESLFFHEGSL